MKGNALRKAFAYLAGKYRGTFPYVTPLSMFHEYRVAEYSPLIELDPSNGLSTAYRDTVTKNGDGDVYEGTDGDLVVASGTQTGADAMLNTKERGRYQPGIVGMPGFAWRVTPEPTGDAEVWSEYGDGIDGLRMGQDSDGIWLEHILGGVGQGRKYQDDWNGDTLTGDRKGRGSGRNPSGEALSLGKFITVREPFIHYGSGPGDVDMIFVGRDGFSVYVTAHTFAPPDGRPIFTNPRLPIRNYASPGTTGINHEVHVGGREFAVLGRYDPNRRETNVQTPDSVSIGDTATPIISLRKKDLRKFASRSVKVSGVGLPSDVNGLFEIIIGGTLTAGGTELTDSDWGSIDRIPADETAVEANQTADAITGGTRIDGGPLVGGGGNRHALEGISGLGLDIPDDVVVTLAAKALPTLSGTVYGTFTLEEEA